MPARITGRLDACAIGRLPGVEGIELAHEQLAGLPRDGGQDRWAAEDRHHHGAIRRSLKGVGPIRVPDIRRWVIRPALKAAGLPEDARTYDLRHAHTSVHIDRVTFSSRV
jgi:hypothetical protein